MTAADARCILARANTPESVRRLAVLDAPDLVATAQEIAPAVAAWCDDAGAAAQLPTALRRDGLDGLTTALHGADTTWCDLPRSLGALDELAGLIARHADSEARLVVLARHADLTRSMNEVLARHFADVRGSLGVGKHRALLADGPLRSASPDPWPKMRHLDDLDLDVWAHGATFAGTRCDPGTRLLVDHLDDVPRGDVLDFGCGSGILATLLARRPGQDPARVLALDVLDTSLDATRRTAAGLAVQTLWADGTATLAPDSLNAIVTNPPFHAGVAKDSSATLAMFADAARVLRPGGELWAVYNSHLPWKARLSALVGPTRLVAQTPRYTLVAATRR